MSIRITHIVNHRRTSTASVTSHLCEHTYNTHCQPLQHVNNVSNVTIDLTYR